MLLRGKRRLSVLRAWSGQHPENPFVPWACPCCPSGRMAWFASDLHERGTVIEHKFACDKCGEIEHVLLPFTPPPPTEAA